MKTKFKKLFTIEKSSFPEMDESLALKAYENDLSEEERERLIHHLTESSFDREKIASLESALEDVEETPLSKVLERKAIKITKEAQKIKKDRGHSKLWLILFLAAIGLSFAFSKYFIQFLVIALVFGLKWAMAKKEARQILINDSIESPQSNRRSMLK